MHDDIFALDIGTRKVMGVLAREVDGCLEIIDVQVIEHPSRPMYDGMIHNIDEVVATVKQIKDSLESRINKKLNKVGVAVAGRNLVTFVSKAEKDLISEQEITASVIRDLELEAVDKISAQSHQKLSNLHCVGYSPVYYELDGMRIMNLAGHKGRRVALEVIVTFLPRMVLESMFTVLERAGLELTNITLEPIAAINAIVPEEMRHLNILLVDVGAGTSDLAITKDGLIFAYGMVPEAGDEISEAVCQALLTDFHTAERIKKSLEAVEDIEYEDIWGKKHSTTSAQVKETLLPKVESLAGNIAKRARELNPDAPLHAVIGVGGGSLTYRLMERLASSLNLDNNRVGIRLPKAIRNIHDKTGKLIGPEAVTPLGITMMTARSGGLKFIEITVNDRKLRMLDFYQKKDILGALILSGIDNKKLYARPGMALTIKVNGELKMIRGTLGEPAKVTLNNEPVSSLSSRIEQGDTITFEEAVDGVDAHAVIGDVVKRGVLSVTFNGEALTINPPVLMNEREASFDTPVSDRALIQAVESLKIRDLLRSKGVEPGALQEKQLFVSVNDAPQSLTARNFSLKLNGETSALDAHVTQDAVVEFSLCQMALYRIKDVVDMPATCGKISVSVDGAQVNINIEPVQIFMNGRRVGPDDFLVDGADIKIYYVKEPYALLSEIFRYIDIDPQRGRGKAIKILVDDMPAGFTTPLKDGSRVRILFEDRM